MVLWRPVGMAELQAVYEARLRAFPPRLEHQPIFYVVLNRSYARTIASRWNTREEPFAGYVLEFRVPDPYAARFERHIVGDASCEEFWVPAEELPRFNEQIEPPIRVVDAYFGARFRGHVPARFMLAGQDAAQQLATLACALAHGPMDFSCEISANHLAVFLNLPYWETCDVGPMGLEEGDRLAVVGSIRLLWPMKFPETPLPRSPVGTTESAEEGAEH